MDNKDFIIALAEIHTATARVEGMKAENLQRESQGDSMAYVYADFEHEARNIEAVRAHVCRYC